MCCRLIDLSQALRNKEERKLRFQAVLPWQQDEQPWQSRGSPKSKDEDRKCEHRHTLLFHHLLQCWALRLAKARLHRDMLTGNLSKRTSTLVSESPCKSQEHRPVLWLNVYSSIQGHKNSLHPQRNFTSPPNVPTFCICIVSPGGGLACTQLQILCAKMQHWWAEGSTETAETCSFQTLIHNRSLSQQTFFRYETEDPARVAWFSRVWCLSEKFQTSAVLERFLRKVEVESAVRPLQFVPQMRRCSEGLLAILSCYYASRQDSYKKIQNLL